jgi:hypothetical protein
MVKFTWIISLIILGIGALGISLMLGRFGGLFRVISIFFFAVALLVWLYPSARQ